MKRSAGEFAKRLLLWVVPFVVLFGAAAGFQAWREQQQEKAALAAAEQKLDRFRPSDCLTARPKQAGTDAGDLLLADCSSAGLTLSVGLKVTGSDECPGQRYFAYRVKLDGRQVGALCLVENLREGHCYTDSATPPLHEEVPCSSSAQEAESVKDARVVKAVEGSDDPSICVDSTAVVYPEPKRVYCMGSPVT
ncbi:hypothetical protein [Segniliparus rugosus]|uniref:Uncharacterized protein n=1 Tax=Segniliparus rugosus (strain ATCC BAA-974 / DSM 45345 / CCUG 50838 / CIP 108380 / JCM 13579 / CDC 945) TaxID=679197 RepID=E5XPT3_SEGRC|nr:hypothetical protein [Segniliparus rugosus]EFV13620.2 hypothetical protein HMPREF9336_01505 [Segniliparus rugosus ATCC BAA-974]